MSFRSVHSGQIVLAQLGVLLVVLTGGHPGGVLAAATLLTVTFGRRGGRWLYRWCRPAVGWALRRRTAPAGACAADLLALAHPGIRMGVGAALLAGGHGDVAVLDVGAPGGGLGAPVSLPDLSDPPATVQPLIVVRPPPATTAPPAISYRELTGGAAAAARRVLVAVRVPPGADLAAAVRRVSRRLAPLPVRPVTPVDLEMLLADVAFQAPVRETWSAVRAGDLVHVTYRVAGDPAALLSVLPALPAAAVVVTYGSAGTLVRVASGSPAQAGTVDRVLRGLLPGPGAANRLDGEHLPGLAATLPLAMPAAVPDLAGAEPAAEVPVAPAGVLLGRDRYGAPVLLAPGPAPLQMVLVGGAPLARLLVWRALGAGAEVRVDTDRPERWRSLQQRATPAPVSLAPPGQVPPPPGAAGRPGRPLLHLSDSDQTDQGGSPLPWTIRVQVRDRITAADAGTLARAGLVVCRALDEPESTLVNAALGLGRAGAGLRDADPRALTVVHHGAVSEVTVAMTAGERDLAAGPVGLTG